MTAPVPALAVTTASIVAVLIGRHSRRRGTGIPAIFLFLSFVLPFAAGGFHTYIAMVTAVFLIGHLILQVRRNNAFSFVFNLNSVAVLLVTASYCLSFLWAADKGMAGFAIVRFLPVLLYALTLMQHSPAETDGALNLIPVSGAFMTVLSCILLLFPGMEVYLTVNGRLSGFLQYPNTFAAFLLAGLILNTTNTSRQKTSPVVDAILITGVILSGSRTGFLLLVATLIGILLLRKDMKLLLPLAAALAAGFLLAWTASGLGLLRSANRFATISTSAGTFLVRLLYYKDALPVILGHPFGVGYLGYRALQGTFQTGRYSVSFIHNGLLQLLLDIGWIPALLLAAAFLRALFSRRTPPEKKLLLLIILGHCMLDFDLQFFLFWVILLSSLDFHSGRAIRIHKGKFTGIALCALSLVLCLWLGTGDLLYSLGRTKACLTLTPFHTDALSETLSTTSSPEELDALADRILAQNPTHSLACSAKANAAFSRGKIALMMEYKEQAIRCAPYATAEYCDYFEKLYTAMQMYLQSGDEASAGYCAKKLLTIPEMMEAVSQNTDPLAHRTGDDMALVLPEEYLALLDQIRLLAVS